MRSVGWKIVVLGEKSVGKTSLVRRFVYDTFDTNNDVTKKNEMYVKNLEYSDPNLKSNITLLIFDISDLEKNLIKFIKNSRGIMIVGDVTKRNTLESMEKYANIIKKEVGHRPTVFVGNKSDLRYMAEFWENELRDLADRFKASYIFTSARTNFNVTEAFQLVVREIMKEKDK